MPKSTTYNCDCMEILKTLPDHSCFLCSDPPFGNANGEFKRQDKSRFGGTFDKYKRNTQPGLNIGGVENKEVMPTLSNVPEVPGRRSMARKSSTGMLPLPKSISTKCYVLQTVL